MFKIARKNQASAAAQVKPFTDVKLAQVTEILLFVGLLDEHVFAELANYPSCYSGNTLEYTQRESGVRFILKLDSTGKVARIQVMNHGWEALSDAELQKVNNRLATILAR